MKIYHVYRLDAADWDEFDGSVVVSDTSAHAIELATKRIPRAWGKMQNIVAVEVLADEERIVLESFNAG